MKLAAFDLETAKILPEDVVDILSYAPLGISCAAVAFSDNREPVVWQGVPQLSMEECQSFVHFLQSIVDSGYTIVTWNGCGFDFRVLAEESGLANECGELALHHIDMMLMVTFRKGYYLSLDKALKGAGLEGKKSRVRLSDGTVIKDMSGAKAPELWAKGEYEAVLQYLNEDVAQLLALTEFVGRTKAINWRSNRGTAQAVTVNRLMTVEEAFSIPEPDTSWMDAPPSRREFVDWIPQWQGKSSSNDVVALNKPQTSSKAQAQTSAEVKPASTTSNMRGCLFGLAAFLLLSFVWSVLAVVISNDTALGCALVLILIATVASFLYFRVRVHTIHSLLRRN